MGLIDIFFPKLALSRGLARLQLQHAKRAYEGGKTTDYHRNRVDSGSPNQNMEEAGTALRARARYYDENLDLVTGLFDSLVTNVVGNTDPIRPLVRNTDGTLNSTYNTALKRFWQEWSVSPTICGQYTMVQALKLACRGWLRDGEYLTRLIRGNTANSPVVPLSLELIEADYLPYEKSENREGVPYIVQGVELNTYNQVVAYHLLTENPADSGYVLLKQDTRRILSEDLLHLKFIRRTHQVRGVTILHSVMNRLDDLKDYEESERISARVSAAMTGFIQKPGETMGNNAQGGRTFEMAPGMIFDNLLPGETVGTIASNRPNPELMNFRAAMLRAIAAGTNSNYSTISKDYNGTYSSQRQELLESKPGYEGLRQQFVDSFIAPIWREFVLMLQTTGKISVEGIDQSTLDDVEMRGIDIGWIDPKKQADATAISIQAGITTRGQVIRDTGGDPASVYAEIEEEEKMFGPLTQTTEEAPGNGQEDTEQNQD